ncbi:hypothetical protein Pmani_019176 [Petrolisthes manimaculis]|uniref:Lysophosphatidylcholine acyltransferase 2 n=1 Tax=Petrolisthes manimaculis TaxID=1843537 RepID=A0AAE1PI83_9EUCA|nr:hypothetical protein Pmani_019176 [Petrolisthes manimaculis]
MSDKGGNGDERRNEGESPPIIQETSQLLNPFVHRLQMDTAYDKFKLVFMSIFVVPVRVLGIILCLIIAYILATAGLWGLTREDLAARPMSGWRRSVKDMVRCWVRGMFTAGAFHLVHVKGHPALRVDAPILAVAPHSSFFDVLLIVVMGAPSIVAKGEEEEEEEVVEEEKEEEVEEEVEVEEEEEVKEVEEEVEEEEEEVWSWL